MGPDLRRVTYTLCAVILVVFEAGIGVSAAAPIVGPRRPFDRIADLLAVPASRMPALPPVRIHGVCTGRDPDTGELFVQDATAGIRVTPTAASHDVAPGDAVDIAGALHPGAYLPVIRPSAVRAHGKAPYPKPAAAPALGIGLGLRDSQWVSSSGVVRAVSIGQGRVTLEVSVTGGPVMLQVPQPAGAPLSESVVDSEVTFQGVCVAQFNAARELISAEVLVPDAGLLRLDSTVPPAPFSLPVTRISDVLSYRGTGTVNEPVHLRGVVEMFRPGVAIFLRDGASSIYIRTTAQKKLEPGDLVDVVGLPDYDQGSPTLASAVFSRIRGGISPEPIPSTAAGLLEPKLDAALVRIDARLVDHMFDQGVFTLVLQVEGRSIEALLETDEPPAALRNMAEGSVLRIVGVCVLLRDSNANPNGARLRLRSADDVRTLSGPPWWTRQRVAAAAGAIGVGALAFLVWTGVLRRQVRRQTDIIRERLDREVVLAEQLRQSQKMEALGHLAGGVAHDFNNLLTVINGHCEMVLDGLEPDDQRRADVEQINDAGARAASLTTQLLAFSRRQVIQPRNLDLNEAVAGATNILRRLIGEDIELHVDASAGCASISADPGQVQQVIVNLAVNARDAMPDGGKLTLSTSTVETDDGGVRLRDGTPATSYVLLTVSDTGTGMNQATVARIFEPFFTTKAAGRGTGLGLSTVYGILSQAGGFVRVTSEVGRGSEFKVFWPLAERAGEVHEVHGVEVADAPTTWRGSETVLVAEDDDAVRRLMVRALRHRGYRVLEAADGMTALRLATEHSGVIDLLVTDVVMPALNGAKLSHLLADARPGVKTLFVSGYTDKAVDSIDLEQPDVSFLQKPFDIDALVLKVRRLLEGQSDHGAAAGGREGSRG